MVALSIVARALGAALLGLGGWQAGRLLGEVAGAQGFLPWGLAGTIAGALVGALITPYVVIVPIRLAWKALKEAPAFRIAAISLGLIVGLVIAALISMPIARIPGWPGIWIPALLSVVLALTGAMVMLGRERDLLRFLPQDDRAYSPAIPQDGKIVLDTSAIIDGRIADISHTGFVHGTMIVPRFVLDELRHIADSSDSVRRNRGRRGLEMLNKLRKEAEVPVQVLDIDHGDGMEVDAKLVQLARSLAASIVTTDFNLNRVAEIQGVKVLNVNELANALKSVVLPGEELQVRVLQEGKEVGQGVGFLDDGTMVVVEGGRRYIDTVLDVTVTRVLQTAAGRLVFAQPKSR